MALVNCLKQVLESNTWRTGNLSSGGQVIIQLKDKQSGMKIQIAGAGQPILAICIGESKNALKHSSALKGMCSRICDCLVILQSAANYYAVFIEMKKTMTGSQGCEQLVRSLPIWDYLISACRIECKINPKVLVKHVLIAEKSNPRLAKGLVRTTPPKSIGYIYKGITIRKFIGVQNFSVSQLVR